MENQLRKILIDTASAFATAAGCALSTVSRRVKKDPNFFTRIRDSDGSFTARSFDEVMEWFATNWPTGKEKPLELLLWMSETGFQPHALEPAEARP
jgi:hypothetical protein